MSLILCVDTALETATVSIACDGLVVHFESNTTQSDHAAWIHLAIKRVVEQAGTALQELNAVAVTSGPGSYTGLRVGMATAKGLCYALNKPLITENTLILTAMAAREERRNSDKDKDHFFCPMIDARRMEVFTALYDENLSAILEPTAMILGSNAFKDELDRQSVVFCGNGAAKWRSICDHPNAVFLNNTHKPQNLAAVAFEKFVSGAFADLAYSEPEYFKNFHSGR